MEELQGTQLPLTTAIAQLRERIGQIEVDLVKLLHEKDNVAQMPMLFNLGRKFDMCKAPLREIAARTEQGTEDVKAEYRRLAQETRQLRARLTDSLLPLFDGFFNKYQFKLANSKSLLEAVYAVRHDVYCRELGFEDLQESSQETDAYDSSSQHVLLTEIDAPDRGIGCIRVVFLDPKSGTDHLPIERLCKKFSSHDPAQAPRDKICEISRLSLLSEHRGTGARRNPLQRLLALGLPLAAYVVGLHNKAEYAYQLCEPALAEYLQTSLGPALSPIGDPVDHRGIRVPTVVHGASSLESMDLIPYIFYRLIEKQLYPNAKKHRSKL